MTKKVPTNIARIGSRLIVSGLAIAVLSLGTVLVLGLDNSAHAQINVFQQCAPAGGGGASASNTELCQATGTADLFGGGSIWAGIIRVITVVIGAVSILMIVVGGLRYTMSGGDGSQTKAAKDTILYSLVGLVIAVLANTIVNFVLNNI